MGWFTKRPAPSAATARLLRLRSMPGAVYAIGDVHGRVDLLRDLEARIAQDAKPVSGAKLIITLGDAVDRGHASAEVIDHLMGPAPAGFKRVCLRGNHEDMMIRFLNAPTEHLAWLGHGGLETLASYGLYLDDPDRVPADIGARMATLIPAAHRKFLDDLAFGVITPDAFFCHAAIDPDRDLDAQLPEDLLWGDASALDGRWTGPTIVHGHVIVETPDVTEARINVDTGAYDTGRLTALALKPGEKHKFIVTAQ